MRKYAPSTLPYLGGSSSDDESVVDASGYFDEMVATAVKHEEPLDLDDEAR